MTAATGSTGPGRIVVGIDGSTTSCAALRWAVRQAALTGQAVHAVLAWRVPFATSAFAVTGIDWEGRARALLDRSIRTVLDGDETAPLSRQVVEGHPVTVLLEAARDAELLVVGCRGQGAFAGMLLGSVSQAVAEHAACPVLVVHEHNPSAGNGEGLPNARHQDGR